MWKVFSGTRALVFLIAASMSAFDLSAFQHAGDAATDTTLSSIRDAEYSLVSATVNGVTLAIAEKPAVSIRFHSGDVFSGRVGVNRYFGILQLTPDGALRVDPASIAVTAQSAEPDAMEKPYLEALRSASNVHLDSNGIALTSGDGATVLQFTRTPMDERIAARTNNEFRLVRFVAGSRQVPLAPAEITFTLTGDNRFTGFSGVNRYSGSFETDRDGRFRYLGPIAATQRAGSPELMELERAFFSALEKVRRFHLSGNRLVLENDDQSVLLEFASTGSNAP